MNTPAVATYPKQASPLLVSAKLYDALQQIVSTCAAEGLLIDTGDLRDAKEALRFARENLNTAAE